LGSGLLLGFGWRSIFYVLAVLSALVILLVWQLLPNTVEKDDSYSLSIKNVLGRYLLVIRNRKFLVYSFVTGMASAVLFTWISSSSFVFIELLSLSELQFGLVFASTATCILLGNQANILLLKKFSSQEIALGAVVAQVVLSGLVMLIVQFQFSFTVMLSGMCILMFFLHMITTNSMSLGLNEISKNLGVATAFMGSLRMALSAVVTFVLSFFLLDSAMPMLIAIMLISGVSFCLQYSVKVAWI
jgi:DHA1 family bicyclomycin/chloramphenicol resistance-like MFS transporter